ncbi:hypothetical protein ACLOJK_020271 [Asimina triloba]
MGGCRSSVTCFLEERRCLLLGSPALDRGWIMLEWVFGGPSSLVPDAGSGRVGGVLEGATGRQGKGVGSRPWSEKTRRRWHGGCPVAHGRDGWEDAVVGVDSEMGFNPSRLGVMGCYSSWKMADGGWICGQMDADRWRDEDGGLLGSGGAAGRRWRRREASDLAEEDDGRTLVVAMLAAVSDLDLCVVPVILGGLDSPCKSSPDYPSPAAMAVGLRRVMEHRIRCSGGALKFVYMQCY